MSSSSTRTNTIQTIALASKGGQKFLPEPLSLLHLGCKRLKSNRGLRASRSRRCEIMAGHQRPWRAQPRARRAAWALWARPEHVGSMAASSADDHLTVGGDANVVVGADPEHAVGTRTHDFDHWIVDGGTQWMPLSAAIKQRLVCGAHGGTGGIVLPASTTNIAFGPPAER